ncbi:MAG TPA: LamG-like jellyroll fold domain-containing protein [Acidobacteriaceae bacterium]|nr:LamG-like jellyroll fold domain-containing protein [Acidobacteriaceae bacterium]
MLFCLIPAGALTARAQQARSTNAPPEEYGPWNAAIPAGGTGLEFRLPDDDTLLEADAPWTLLAWVNAADAPSATELVAGMGAPDEEYPRYLALAPGRAVLYLGEGNTLEGVAAIAPGSWHLLVATFDGNEFRLYVDGAQVATSGLLEPGQTRGGLLLGSVSPKVGIGPAPEPAYFQGPRPTDEPGLAHFGGKVYGLTILREALEAEAIRAMAATHPDFALPVYDQGSKPWPVQTNGQAGYRAPQSPDQMPHSRAPFQQPQAIPAPSGPAITAAGEDRWRIDGGWKLSAAPQVEADGAQISGPDFSTKGWYAAVVPGTVLTTLVDRGVYPNPYYGLNNLAIPETLNKQDYWYRTEFRGPEAARGKRLTLTFEGINYKAEVWLNGQRLGEVKGAFLRGVFDVTGLLRPGKTNVLAVRISPPPHPGIPQEQSIKGGPGANGGMMCLDGPTFVATEGWDWIPGIRDRDTGIWQPVMLRATEDVTIGDPQVVTTLPLPGIESAKVDITVPLTDAADKPVHAKLTAQFEGVTVTKQVDLEPGENAVQLTPAEFAQLDVQNPRLWWPNGYGPANLYHLKLTAAVDGRVSDTKELQFGIREITYELSLLNPAGRLVRVNFSPTAAHDAGETQPVIDNTHQGIRDIPVADAPPPNAPAAWREFMHAWVESLTPAGEHSPAIAPSSDLGTAPYLVILVNGVRIAVRGGNWGMDDAMKDVSRAHLEPYFRLHHDAGENVIRNWVGQSTEETFYDLADEYGFLVWNGFWESTQNYNIEPENPALFLRNARDVILRFRNHPSIAVWCGRNEGVPQPIINQGLANLVRTLDGTRYYSPSSNEVDLQGSGPYRYQDPALYYTTLNHGFSVETGSPSMSTLESFEAWTPKADWWPIDDVWAYHDWHFMGGGDIHPFMAEMQTEFGAPTSLGDFERKAQMMDYVDYRAIFEGMAAHLWAPNSGRLLWMTQPAWPSNMWEVLSWDYDTQSSYYGEKEALQPLHIQLDLATDAVEVVNTTRSAPGPLQATANVYSLANKSLLHQTAAVNVAADNMASAMTLNLGPLEQRAVILVELKLHDATGQMVSRNLYWLAGESRDFQQLSRLPQATVSATATSGHDGRMLRVRVELKNTGTDVALQNKLTLVNASTGKRILPAYYSDNYVSLLPGEAETVEIEYPAIAADGAAPALTLRSFNLPQRNVEVAAGQ